MTRHPHGDGNPKPPASAHTTIRTPGESPGTNRHNPRTIRAATESEPSPTRRRAFTLAEAAVSVLIVGVMLVAVMNAVGAARLSEYKLANENRALLLAQGLMAEILQQNYAEPGETVPAIGEDAGEHNGKRDGYDDVDDYDTWSATPPQRRDGTDLSTLTSWVRSVEVDWVNLGDLSQVIGSNQGVKRIIVTVKFKGMELAKLVAYRSDV